MLQLLAACNGPGPGPAGATGDTGAPAPPAVFDAVGFNVESGGSDPDVVAAELVAPIGGETLWGFVEVEDDGAARALVGAAADAGTDQDFAYVLGTTGFSDRMVLAWDDTVFALESHEELDEINVGGNVRAPLVGRMRHRATETVFLLVVNHLWRTDTAARHEQARLLNDWGADQTEPVVMVGDYNFDWEVETGDHDRGYDELTEGGVFRWVRPDTLLKTQCSGYYDSVLDFVFVGGPAKDWPATSEILRPSEEYCSQRYDATFPDHRPVRASFTLP